MNDETAGFLVLIALLATIAFCAWDIYFVIAIAQHFGIWPF